MSTFDKEPVLLSGDQLNTLNSLGRICGARVYKGARICGENAFHFCLMVSREYLRAVNVLERRFQRLAKDVGWGDEREQALAKVYASFVSRVMEMLDVFLSSHVRLLHGSEEYSFSRPEQSGKDLALLVVFALDIQSYPKKKRFSSYKVWRKMWKRIKKAVLAAKSGGYDKRERRKAARFIALVFLAQLLSCYRVEPRTEILSFLSAFLDKVWEMDNSR